MLMSKTKQLNFFQSVPQILGYLEIRNAFRPELNGGQERQSSETTELRDPQRAPRLHGSCTSWLLLSAPFLGENNGLWNKLASIPRKIKQANKTKQTETKFRSFTVSFRMVFALHPIPWESIEKNIQCFRPWKVLLLSDLCDFSLFAPWQRLLEYT